MFIETLVLLLAIPIGHILALLTPEELKDGQKYFRAIILASLIVGTWFFLVGESYITWTAGFILIVTFFSLKKFE